MKQTIYSIYLFTFPNGKQYCGFTSQKPAHRWNNGHGYEKCPLVYRAIMKYGWENIKKEIVFTFTNKEEALQKEKEIISSLKLTDVKYGYNLHEGGAPTGNSSFLTDEGRKKISEIHKKLWSTPEYREKMKKATEGKLGHHPCSEYAKQVAREIHTGITPKNAKSVLQLDKDTLAIIAEYPSASHASLAIIGNKDGNANILNVCKGKRKTAYGYKWRFKNDSTES